MRRRPRALVPAVLAVATILSSGLSPVIVRAAETPDGAVNALLDAIVEKRWDELGPLVCEEKRAEIVGQFDLAMALGDTGGVDVQPFIDSLTFSIADRTVTVLSEVDDTASVQLSGFLTATVDAGAATEWLRAALEATGQPADDATIDGFLAELTADMAEGDDLGSTVDVVRTDGDWLVCDDLEEDEEPVGSFDPGASLPPVEDALCFLMTVEEASAATGLPFAMTTPSSGGCDWGSDPLSEDSFSVSLYREDGELEFIKGVWEGEDLTIAGLPAWTTDNGTWIDLGDGLLVIIPWLLGEGVQETVDPRDLATRIGELVVPRLP